MRLTAWNISTCCPNKKGRSASGPSKLPAKFVCKLQSPCCCLVYSVDSISNPQASRSGSGMYLEFLLRRAHSRRRVERKYWSGESLYSRTTCSNSVMVGTTGPIGSGLPQLGFPRLLAMKSAFLNSGGSTTLQKLINTPNYMILRALFRMQVRHKRTVDS